MSRRHFRLSCSTLVLLLMACATHATAQGAIAGTWTVRYEWRPRSSHGDAPPAPQIVEGRLTVRTTADSLFGEWQLMVARGDSAPPPQKVVGLQRRDSAFLRLVPLVDEGAGLLARAAHEAVEFIRTYVHGMPPATTAFEGVVRGDTFAGLRRVVLLDGTPAGTQSALTAVRVRP